MKIALIGEFLPIDNYVEDLREHGTVERYPSATDASERVQYASGSEIVITHDEFRKETISKLKETDLLISWTTGLDNVDLEAAERHGIKVVNTPDYCSRAVAEHVIGLTFAITRRIPQAKEAVDDGSWDCMPFKGVELRGKTMGVVGMGKIGKRVEELASAIGMKTLVNNRSETSYENEVSLETVLRKSNVVALTVDLNDSSSGLIGEEELKLIKDDAYIINTSRGEVINEPALFDAIESEEIGGAALDVLADEPEVPNRVKELDDLVVTPHTAWLTEKSIDRGAKTVLGYVKEYVGENSHD